MIGMSSIMLQNDNKVCILLPEFITHYNCSVDETKHDYFIRGTNEWKVLQQTLENLLLESEDDDTLLQTMLLLFKLHNQAQLLVADAKATYIITHPYTGKVRSRVVAMTTFEDEGKVMLRLLQQKTDHYKDAIVRELMNSARSCMVAENESQPAEFMQNILFTSGILLLFSC